MAEYIEREAVLAMKKPFPTSKDSITLHQQYFISPSAVEKIPAADVRPVVHAHWEWDENGMDWNIGAWECSACKRKPETWWSTQKFYPSRCAGSHFCGNCGAIMDEEVP